MHNPQCHWGVIVAHPAHGPRDSKLIMHLAAFIQLGYGSSWISM